MSLANMIISAIMKKGILYEARNCDINCDVPVAGTDGKADSNIKINIKIDHMTLRFDKENGA